VPTALSERYDAFVHVEETEALHPLHIEPEGTEEPETYPWGI
jgi:erythromycin esterase